MNQKMKVVSPTNDKADELTAKLEAQLQEITHKKQLADNRQVFLLKRNNLQEYKKSIQEELQSGNFESAKFKLSISSSNTYRDDEKLTISNTDLILFFIDGLLQKIDEEVIKLELELIK
jgi:hypothetical protein